jgi:hypothetical protein
MKPSLRSSLLTATAVLALTTLATGVALAKPNTIPSPSSSGPSPTTSDSSSFDPSTGPSWDPSGGPTGEPSGDPSPEPTGSTTPEPTGSIAGTLTTSSGGPLAYSSVTVQTQQGPPYFFTATDTDGHYRVDNVPPGSYTVAFSIPPTYLYQYAHGKQTYGDTFPVTAGNTTVVDDQALPTGTIAGHFTDQAGHPLAAQIYASNQSGGTGMFGQTDSAGAFSLAVFAGTYTVSFTYGNGTIQYARGQFDSMKATPLVVAGGATVVVDETALPGGTVSGKVSAADGSPAGGGTVQLSGTTNNQYLSTTVAADGTYHLDSVPPGSYTVQFSSADGRRHQWASNTTNYWKAAVYTVKANETTKVDDRFVATGTLAVNAVDASTGKPLDNVCAYLWQGGTEAGQCGGPDGKLTFTDVPVGSTYQLSGGVQNDRYLNAVVDNIVIKGGQTTTVTLTVKLAAIIETTALDAKTHQPVANVCVAALPTGATTIPNSVGYCTDEHGKVRIPNLTTGAYTLFATPMDGVHGIQWVGARGGTGSQYQARQVRALAGSVTVAPTIYLDGAGTLSGVVTDKTTGKPLPFVCVSPGPASGYWSRIGECAGGATDAQGRYTISNLGPYAWPILFAPADNEEHGSVYAWQWSGGVTSRKQAAPVKVTTGGTTTLNAKLSHGTVLKGRVVGGPPTQVPVEYMVSAIDPQTGDPIGTGTVSWDGTYEFHLLPQNVFLSYGVNRPPAQTHWYRDAKDFAHATPVTIGNQKVILNLSLS